MDIPARIFYNFDKTKLVFEGDKDAAFLFAHPGKKLTAAEIQEARSAGLDDLLNGEKTGSNKNKAAAKNANKSAKKEDK